MVQKHRGEPHVHDTAKMFFEVCTTFLCWHKIKFHLSCSHNAVCRGKKMYLEAQELFEERDQTLLRKFRKKKIQTFTCLYEYQKKELFARKRLYKNVFNLFLPLMRRFRTFVSVYEELNTLIKEWSGAVHHYSIAVKHLNKAHKRLLHGAAYDMLIRGDGIKERDLVNFVDNMRFVRHKEEDIQEVHDKMVVLFYKIIECLPEEYVIDMRSVWSPFSVFLDTLFPIVLKEAQQRDEEMVEQLLSVRESIAQLEVTCITDTTPVFCSGGMCVDYFPLAYQEHVRKLFLESHKGQGFSINMGYLLADMLPASEET